MTKKELEYIKKFHGHVGPWVLAGFALGNLARRYLKPLTKIYVKNPLQPPLSCLIDGLQLGSGKTLGRGEVRLIEGKKIEITFISKNKEVRIKLDHQFKKLLAGYKNKYHNKLIRYIGNTFIAFFK